MDRLTTESVASLSTAPVVNLTTETVDKLTTPLGTSLESSQGTSSSHHTISHVTAKYGLVLDDAINKIIRRCRTADDGATPDEIAYFLEVKINQLRGRKDISNWTGMLLQAVPAYFVGEKIELARYREAKVKASANQRRQAQAILDDPDSTEQDRKLAQSILRGF